MEPLKNRWLQLYTCTCMIIGLSKNSLTTFNNRKLLFDIWGCIVDTKNLIWLCDTFYRTWSWEILTLPSCHAHTKSTPSQDAPFPARVKTTPVHRRPVVSTSGENTSVSVLKVGRVSVSLWLGCWLTFYFTHIYNYVLLFEIYSGIFHKIWKWYRWNF